ncbi:hypothetical protein HPB49_006752 [Dermacentor silvarum]|uniref:Uncharacterized protein n=1 Tax=Dermacentor silvarum TaxID=543639 RepID=A0ACB8DJ10_DERSI|nr:hypothetical protein HPB49_006752 [Dermacentor silvarum]
MLCKLLDGFLGDTLLSTAVHVSKRSGQPEPLHGSTDRHREPLLSASVRDFLSLPVSMRHPLPKSLMTSQELSRRFAPGKHSASTADYPLAVDGAANGKLCEAAGLNHKRRRLGGDQEESLADELSMYCGRLPVPPVYMPAADHHQRGARIGRSFLTIRHNASVFHTEEWKPRGCTMYLPLTQDVMINMRCIDQVSFESDQFFLADGKGNYIGAKSEWMLIEK